MTRAREAETKFIREQNELEITKAKEMSGIETEKFKNMVDSIGSDTIASIANAGPEMQVGQVTCRMPGLVNVVMSTSNIMESKLEQ